MNGIDGEVYQAQSGQWSFRVTCDGEELCGGGGFYSEDQARDAMAEVLADYQVEE